MKILLSLLLIICLELFSLEGVQAAKKVVPRIMNAEVLEQGNASLVVKGESIELKVRVKNTGTVSWDTWGHWVLSKEMQEPVVLLKDGANNSERQFIGNNEVGTFVFSYTPIELGPKTITMQPYLPQEKKEVFLKDAGVQWSLNVIEKPVVSTLHSVQEEPDITEYTNAVGFFVCLKNSKVYLGSGILMDLEKPTLTGSRYNILTNSHVLEGASSCKFYLEKQRNNTYPELDFGDISSIALYNQERDAALVPILSSEFDYQKLRIRAWNWKVSKLDECDPQEKIGRKLFTIGYPASSELDQYYSDENGEKKVYKAINQIVTDGIISGYAYNYTDDPKPDYFVSSSIDHGNSGGLALAEKNGGFCTLGMPSWINKGISASLGIVLNIKSLNLNSKDFPKPQSDTSL